MRLLNTSTLEFHEFFLSEIPQYAILSHTWGEEEVTFQDMSSPSRSLKKGYTKIILLCEKASRHNVSYAWIDTCCIDKSSSADLTESINSMFRWYKDAVVCYVFLEDLPPGQTRDMARCRWFTRGWTLQELLAPKNVQFFDMGWNYRGSKLDLIDLISNATNIHREVLEGTKNLSDCSVATRMSWASHRQTARIEDIGYCLLGIFDVNMPLLYGEGVKAFRRLQEEIIKRNNDLTIFAWSTPGPFQNQVLGLFAESPTVFSNSSGIYPFFDDFINFSVTNKGLFISGDVQMRVAIVSQNGSSEHLYLIILGHSSATGGIYLRKFGPKLFYRDERYPLAGFGANDMKQVDIIDDTNYYILIDQIPSRAISSRGFRDCALHVPSHATIFLKDKVPETLWDATDRVFLRPKPYSSMRYPMILAMAFHAKFSYEIVDLVAFCDYREHVPICGVCRKGSYPRQEAIIFEGRNRQESVDWTEMELRIPSNKLRIRAGSSVFEIVVSLERGIIESISKEVEVISLIFHIS